MKRNRRLAVVLVDYENIKYNATIRGGLVDFKKLREIILEEIGEILFSFVFIPDHKAVDLPADINSEGFEIITCQRTKEETGKLEDSVDIHMIKMGMKFCAIREISDIVIVGHDGHMTHLVSDGHNRKIKITVIGQKTVMSKALTKVVDSNNIYDLPVIKKM